MMDRRIQCAIPIILASSVACGDELDRSAFLTMVIDEETVLPPSPTNRYADDPGAAELGQIFFFDRGFSPTRNTCWDCHDIANGGADSKAVGATSGPFFQHNTPTVIAAGFTKGWNHWAGLFTSLWGVPPDLAIGATGVGMARHVYDRYRSQWEAVFGPMPDLSDTSRFPPNAAAGSPEWMAMAPEDQAAINTFVANVGKATEAYIRLLNPQDAPFDRWAKGDDDAMSPSAVRGAQLFVGKAACNECHLGPGLRDMDFHNIGVPQVADGPVPDTDYGHAGTIGFASSWPYSAHSEFSDDVAYGEAMIAKLTAPDPEDLATNCDEIEFCGAFLTQTLRNVALTAPYMHTGGLKTLQEVVEFYNDASNRNFQGQRDVRVKPLGLTDSEVRDLVDFLEALTGTLPEALENCPPAVAAEDCAVTTTTSTVTN